MANNNILDKAEEIKVDREFQGPESIAFRGDEIFTGLIGGELVRIKNGKSTTIIEKTKNNKPCGRNKGHKLIQLFRNVCTELV